MARILILAGTTEATELAAALVADGHEVTSSLAGVTRSPSPRAGAVRRGGFGGVVGLDAYLRDHDIEVLVDATHPFAAVMPFHAVDAAAASGVPTCRLLRAPWTPVSGDAWHPVPTMEAAPDELRRLDARRVFLAVGRQSAAVFAECADMWFLVRAIEPPAGEWAEVVLQRGPFGLDDEIALLREHLVDTMVVKNSGGTATSAKLDAARRCGVRVVVVERPPQPDTLTFESVSAVAQWCQRLSK